MKKLIARLLNKPVYKLYTWICVTICEPEKRSPHLKPIIIHNAFKLSGNTTKLCKCGKPLPTMPHYCSTCGEGTMGKKKMVIIGEFKQVSNPYDDEIYEVNNLKEKICLVHQHKEV